MVAPDEADAETRGRLLADLRAYGHAFHELARSFGAQAGLHTTDATALVEILMAEDRGTPLTQSGLSQRIGLTTGATSSLLNRLELAGHIVRLRDRADRRVVTLRATAGVSELVDHYFNPLTARMNEVMDRYAPGTLAAFERFITEIKGVMEAYTTASPGAPAGGR